MTIGDLEEFCENIFSICTFLDKKFNSEQFQRNFSALEEITKNFRLLQKRITEVQSKLDPKDQNYKFLADIQSIIF